MSSSKFPGDRTAAVSRHLLFFALCAAGASAPVLAVTTVWNGSDGGLWTAGPWIDATPQAGDDALLLAPTGSIPGSQTVLYDETGAPALASLTIDGTAGASMTLDHGANTLHTATLTLGASGAGLYVLSGGTLTVTGTSSVGAAGLGTFTQSNAAGDSTHTTATLVLGASTGASGDYSLTDTGSGFALSLAVGGDTIVGGDGTGTFTQDGGAVTTGALYLGGGPNPPYTDVAATGTYTLIAGTLSAGATNVGNNGAGVFLQSGGTFHAGALLLGNAGGTGGNSYGQFFLSGTGTLVSTDVTIGAFGRGEFTQSGGTHTVGGTLVLGDGPAIGGTPVRGGFYTLAGGSLDVGGSTIVGGGNDGFPGEPGGDGSFTQTGGTHTVAGDLIVGETGAIAGGTGSYALGGTGTLAVTGALRLGAGGSGFGGSGSFTQTAGSASAAQLLLGTGDAGAAGTGSYTLAGGTLDIAGQSFIGEGGSGSFTQTGGSYATDYIDVGIVPNSTGTFTIRGGSATARVNLVVGSDATTTASVAQTGGSVFVQSPDFGLYVNGSYTLSNADGPASLAVTHDAVIGDTHDGSFTQLQGTVTVGHDLILGSGTTAGVTGSYALAGGTLTVGGRVSIGQAAGVAGSYVQTGGTLQTGTLALGLSAGSAGHYAQRAGIVRVAGDATIGAAGTGTYGQTGGLLIVGGHLLIGAEAGASGSYALDNGTLAVGGTIVLGGTTAADGGSGALAISGTANVFAHGLDLRPGGRLAGLGGGITLGDSAAGNAAAGTILVNRGGTLAGNGTIPGSVTVADGGAVSPGNSIGTLTVGDIAFGSGSTLRVEVDGAGRADLLHANGTVTIDGGTLRIDSVDGSYSTDASYTVLTADGGVRGTFPNVVTSLPLLAQQATYTTNAITLVVPTPDDNASRSAVDLIGGSPASLLGRMTLGDVEAGFLLDPLAAGIEQGQAGIGLRVGRYYADGYRQTYEELPIRYAWKLDNGLTVLGELPIATITTSGRGVNRQDRSYGLGGGLRIPMAEGWELKPMLRYGTVVDDDFDHIGSLASATLTSHFRTGFGNGYEFGADNLIGYVRAVGGNVVGLDARYRLHEVALHNAVRVGGPLEGTWLGSGARWTAWISDTRYFGSDLATDNFQRIGIAASTRVTVGERYSENLSLGLNYTQSAGGDHGVELNFGYRF